MVGYILRSVIYCIHVEFVIQYVNRFTGLSGSWRFPMGDTRSYVFFLLFAPHEKPNPIESFRYVGFLNGIGRSSPALHQRLLNDHQRVVSLQNLGSLGSRLSKRLCRSQDTLGPNVHFYICRIMVSFQNDFIILKGPKLQTGLGFLLCVFYEILCENPDQEAENA